jgi:TRAP-type C4-dicarboxylate transport system substrate-binding protein
VICAPDKTLSPYARSQSRNASRDYGSITSSDISATPTGFAEEHGRIRPMRWSWRACAAASATRVLKMGYLYVRDSQLGAGAAEFIRRVEGTTHGTCRIEEYPNGAFGGEVEMLDGLRKGELDLAFLTAAPISSLVPEFGIFDLPFLFRDAAHARALIDGPFGQEYLAKFRAYDLVALAWGETGMRHLTNSIHPVRVPEDLQGLKLRVPQSDVTLRCFQQLGVQAATLGFPALYGALESGHHLTLTGHVYSAAVILISEDLWEDLSFPERDMFTEAARTAGLVSRQVADRSELDGIAALRAAGMQIVPEVDKVAFQRALEPTWSEFARQFGQRQIDRIRAQS